MTRRTRLGMTRRLAATALTVVIGAACGGDDDGQNPPAIVAQIGPALAALDPGTELFQVASTPDAVELVAQDGTDAVGYTYADGALSAGEPLGPASGFTFVPEAVAFDPERVLDGITDELDDPLITRFEVLGGPDGVLYSASVLSEAGGVLLVDLGPEGDVLGAAPAG